MPNVFLSNGEFFCEDCVGNQIENAVVLEYNGVELCVSCGDPLDPDAIVDEREEED